MLSVARALLPSTMSARRACCRALARAPPRALAAPDGAAAAEVAGRRFSVAPMMDFTDRHLRHMLRLLSRNATLWTEMVTAPTLVHRAADADRWLRLSDAPAEHARGEHPVVLQLGGSDPEELRAASATAAPFAYDELNLNCGCPSEKVAGRGCFGAALMREPALVAELCDAMREGAGARTPLSVKCRIGVDDDDSYEQLARFVATVTGADARVRHVAVHARKAILGGLSPADNRRIPPLRYDVVERLARDFPHVAFTLNGGVLTYEDVEAHLAAGFAGVMVGRQVTARPWYWAELDTRVFGAAAPPPTAASRRVLLAAYGEHAAREEARIAASDRPERRWPVQRAMIGHTLNLFAGEPGGKRYRRAIDAEMAAVRAAGASPPVSEILTRASEASLHPDTLDAPPGERARVPAQAAAVAIGLDLRQPSGSPGIQASAPV